MNPLNPWDLLDSKDAFLGIQRLPWAQQTGFTGNKEYLTNHSIKTLLEKLKINYNAKR